MWRKRTVRLKGDARSFRFVVVLSYGQTTCGERVLRHPRHATIHDAHFKQCVVKLACERPFGNRLRPLHDRTRLLLSVRGKNTRAERTVLYRRYTDQLRALKRKAIFRFYISTVMPPFCDLACFSLWAFVLRKYAFIFPGAARCPWSRVHHGPAFPAEIVSRFLWFYLSPGRSFSVLLSLLNNQADATAGIAWRKIVLIEVRSIYVYRYVSYKLLRVKTVERNSIKKCKKIRASGKNDWKIRTRVLDVNWNKFRSRGGNDTFLLTRTSTPPLENISRLIGFFSYSVNLWTSSLTTFSLKLRLPTLIT